MKQRGVGVRNGRSQAKGGEICLVCVCVRARAEGGVEGSNGHRDGGVVNHCPRHQSPSFTTTSATEHGNTMADNVQPGAQSKTFTTGQLWRLRTIDAEARYRGGGNAQPPGTRHEPSGIFCPGGVESHGGMNTRRGHLERRSEGYEVSSLPSEGTAGGEAPWALAALLLGSSWSSGGLCKRLCGADAAASQPRFPECFRRVSRGGLKWSFHPPPAANTPPEKESCQQVPGSWVAVQTVIPVTTAAAACCTALCSW